MRARDNRHQSLSTSHLCSRTRHRYLDFDRTNDMGTNSDRTTEYPGVEDRLSTYFHRSAAVVRQYADL